MAPRPPLVLIAAVARGGALGLRGGLPWSYPEDMRFFRRTTTGHAILVGRVTQEGIGRPLPNRRTIVVSRSGASLPGCETAPDLAAAIVRARETDPCPHVIGGAALYVAAMPYATELRITEIDREVEADAFFPPIDPAEFTCVERVAGESPELTFVRYLRADASHATAASSAGSGAPSGGTPSASGSPTSSSGVTPSP